MPGEWKSVRVFISSTFNDMHSERDYLVKRVFPLLQEWCEKRRLLIFDVDLRWGISEQEVTQKKNIDGKNIVETCLSYVDECEIFLCLLGQRRGRIVREDEISKDQIKKLPDIEKFIGRISLTEMEILHAIRPPGISPSSTKSPGDSKRDKHCFFYFRKPFYLKDLPTEPIQLRKIYEGDNEANRNDNCDSQVPKWLEESIIITNYPLRAYETKWDKSLRTPELIYPLQCPFKDPENIKDWQKKWEDANVYAAGNNVEVDPIAARKAVEFNEKLSSGRLMDFKYQDIELSEKIIEDLKPAITHLFPTNIEIDENSQSPFEKEIEQQERFLFMNIIGFVERENDFVQIDQYVKGKGNQIFILTAEGGAGKSTLLANWIVRFRSKIKEEKNRSVYFRFIGASDTSTSLCTLLNSLMHEINEVNNKIFEKEIPDDPLLLKETWPEFLRSISIHGKTVIVIDAINQLEDSFSNLSWFFLRQLPENIKLIVSFKTGEPPADKFYRYLQETRGIIISEVKRFDKTEDRKKIIEKYLSQYLKKLDDDLIRELEKSSESKMTEHKGVQNPLFLKIVLSELHVFGAFPQLAEKICRGLGDTPVSAFQGVLNRIENDHALFSPILEKKHGETAALLFGFLSTARKGLSIEELKDLFNREWSYEDNDQNRLKISDTIHLFIHQVQIFMVHRNEYIDFFFESFKTAAHKKYNREKDFHQKLARYFRVKADPENNFTWKGNSSRDFRELLYHQYKGEMWDDVERTICDLLYIASRININYSEWSILISDIDNILKTKDIPILAQMCKILLDALPAIKFRGELTIQCLYNRLKWIDSKVSNFVQPSLDRASNYLNNTPGWICAESPLPVMQKSHQLTVTFQNTFGQTISPSLERIAVINETGEVEIFDINLGSLLYRYSFQETNLKAIAIAEDDQSLAYMTHNGIIKSKSVYSDFYLKGRDRENLLVYRLSKGIFAVRKDDALVCWNPENNEAMIFEKDVPKPLIVLKLSMDGQSLLFAAGYKNQLIGVLKWDGKSWKKDILKFNDLSIADAALDEDNKHLLLATIDRRLIIMDLAENKFVAQLFYERLKNQTILGTPVKCVLGKGELTKKAFLATDKGHILCWDWEQGTFIQYEDYRSLNEYSMIVLMELLPSGKLYVTTTISGKFIEPKYSRTNKLNKFIFPVGKFDNSIRHEIFPSQSLCSPTLHQIFLFRFHTGFHPILPLSLNPYLW